MYTIRSGRLGSLPSWRAKLFLPQADALDLPFQIDAGIVLHARAHGLAEILDIRRGGTAKIDQEVTVQLRDLSIAEPQPAATRCVDELPSLLSGRILERRTPRAALDGWVASRASVILSISAPILPASPRAPWNSASVKMTSSEMLQCRYL